MTLTSYSVRKTLTTGKKSIVALGLRQTHGGGQRWRCWKGDELFAKEEGEIQGK